MDGYCLIHKRKFTPYFSKIQVFLSILFSGIMKVKKRKTEVFLIWNGMQNG